VNRHLHRLNEKGALDELGLPAAFEIVTVDDGGRVRFRQSGRPPEQEQVDDDYRLARRRSADDAQLVYS
jgi:hypothetical protein